ncbi:MAG: SAM-dependent methyltransferase, partial [Hyphomicrobium denitrificans]|nr:SAM-dependent methyltransferase [Hyphomicrobium denitrificans]
MTRKDPQKAEFVAGLAAALDGKTFIKLTLGKFRGEGEASKAVATLVALKDVPHLKVVTSFARKDDTKTFSINDGINAVKALIGET